MWQSNTRTLCAGRTTHHVICQDDKPLSYADVVSLWRDNQSFRTYFSKQLTDSSFQAYRWETPCVTKSTLDRDFEFVLLRCDMLERPIDAKAFAAHFKDDTNVVSFSNLGGDATLVVPCPAGNNNSIYGHLASFLRGVDESRSDELWRQVALAMDQRIGEKPVWLSTAGMGVSWLHVRLDDTPKYYGFEAYRAE